MNKHIVIACYVIWVILCRILRDEVQVRTYVPMHGFSYAWFTGTLFLPNRDSIPYVNSPGANFIRVSKIINTGTQHKKSGSYLFFASLYGLRVRLVLWHFYILATIVVTYMPPANSKVESYAAAAAVDLLHLRFLVSG